MTATIYSHHPDYDLMFEDWKMMRDAYDGERAVKNKDTTYLPMPGGFKLMDDKGVAAYDAYKMRARFPTILGPTVRGMNGIIHRTEAQISLPKELEGLYEKATPDGLTLEGLHRRITIEILKTGRYGLLADMPEDAQAGDLPFIATYRAESIINWSTYGDFFMLDETRLVRSKYSWAEQVRYRVLELDKDGNYTVTIEEGNAPVVETSAAQSSSAGEDTRAGDDVSNKPAQDSIGEPVTPAMAGGKALKEIPFVVIGPNDVKTDIDEMPLLGVAQSAYTMYRLDADYKLQLYMTGQETLVLTNAKPEDKPAVIGAGVVVTLPENATAGYVGPSGVGIKAHREAIQDEKQAAIDAGSRLFDIPSRNLSGVALRLVYSAQTATLTSVAQAAAQGLEKALKWCAEFIGANPDEVSVKPNLSLIDATLTPADAQGLVSVWQSGAIAKQTLYENLQRGEIASAERTFEDEEALIADEMPDMGGVDPLLSPSVAGSLMPPALQKPALGKPWQKAPKANAPNMPRSKNAARSAPGGG